MRLPLRHPPHGRDAQLRRCAYLEALAEHARGLALGPAADLVTPRGSRGRYGSALQWHFGLEPHDGLDRLDWEDRIELKLVSVWRARDGLACDKLKVCDLTIDPWHKLGNVLWVFADRLTRVVVGHRFTRLGGPMRERLEASWTIDPHFEKPSLFVEAREQEQRQAPAYYLSAAWFRAEGLLPRELPGVLPFDSRWWSGARTGGREPLITLWRGEAQGELVCPRCGGPIRADHERLGRDGWAPAVHAMPFGERCGLRAHFAVAASNLALGPGEPGRAELESALQGLLASDQVERLADHVVEPDDHLH
ncbi:hypothetical protein OV203_23485 [Nannocystis sp. ILAH1]|uniref:hypothetical protein n=1 Tax=Nannocystis sp. ILAH1 TaxID=2996789 RepID=UPI00226F2873|nr:hypothetical protein [Nannocystis sp. ILAH1]MCY0990122.1 hypothetical protein [Nannocystis sp. ILAH1]